MKLTLKKKALEGFMKVFTGSDTYRNMPVYFLQEKEEVRVFIKALREFVPDKGDKRVYDPFFISRTFPQTGETGTGIVIKDAEKIQEICEQVDDDMIILNCDTGKKSMTAEFAVEKDNTYNLIDTCEVEKDDGCFPDLTKLSEYNDKMSVYFGDGEIAHVVIAGNTYATLEMYTPGDCGELTDIISGLNGKYQPDFKKGENFMAKARRAQKAEEPTAENAVEEGNNNEEPDDKKTEDTPKSDQKAGKSGKDNKPKTEKGKVINTGEETDGGVADEGVSEKGATGKATSLSTEEKVEKEQKQKNPKKKKRTREEIEKDNFDWCIEFLDERGYDAVKREMSIEDALANITKCVDVIKGEQEKPLDKETLLEQLQVHLKE